MEPWGPLTILCRRQSGGPTIKSIDDNVAVLLGVAPAIVNTRNSDTGVDAGKPGVVAFTWGECVDSSCTRGQFLFCLFSFARSSHLDPKRT